MLEEFLKYIKDNGLAGKDDTILLAVSGGIDSMVMAHLFLKSGFRTGIAHCNFSLRGDESDKDEELVRRFADYNGLTFHSVRFDTKKYAAGKKISIQMAARDLRYEWFETIRKKNSYSAIAVAHNLNDNIETMLINLVRGTGVSGLTGMKPSGGKIIRPLLFATRSMIEEYCSMNNIEFREDRSNAETKYTRNKIRHLIIPVLKEINPSIEETLSKTALRLSGIYNIARDYIESVKKQASYSDGKNIIFRRENLDSFTGNASLIFELFREYGLNSASAGDLINIIKGRTGSQIRTTTHLIVSNRDELVVIPSEEASVKEYVIEDQEDLLKVPFIISAEIYDDAGSVRITDNKHIAFIDYRKISYPLLIRGWRKGDSFIPLGMKRKKKLSDFFIDSKIPVFRKNKIMILESAGEIVWLIGERIDDRFKVTDSTKSILRIESSPGQETML